MRNYPVYLDYAATTPLDARVLTAMLPYFSQDFGNPSSIHMFGQAAEAAIEKARMQIAADLNAQPEEIIFTGCGSESDNLAIRGAALAQRKIRGAKRILITPLEHHAVSHTVQQMAEDFGFEVDYLPVGEDGMLTSDAVEAKLAADVALVSVIYANNEIGTVSAIGDIAKVCRSRGIPFHTDAVQAGAHLRMDVQRDGVDLMSLGAHKFYGPKGVGVLYIRKGVPFISTMTGGKQEEGRRAGTHNVPYIVGMAEAFRLAQERVEERAAGNEALRDLIIEGVLGNILNARLTGHPVRRLPNHASFVFEHVDGNLLLMLLDQAGFACSSGSACKVGSPKPSEVLLALGLLESWVMGSLRVTTGSMTRREDIERFVDILPKMVGKARV